MKNSSLILAAIAVSTLISCDNTSTTTASADSSNAGSMDSNSASSNTSVPTDDNTTNTTSMTSRMPLSKTDSAFAMSAAAGNMLEIESAKLAQANATNERVKAFADMMIADHQKANTDLMALVGGRLTMPDSLPADKRRHVEAMKMMKGKGFDKHYVSMMVQDHKKDIAEFEKASAQVQDAGLKTFASNTLPVLKMHRDSIVAISKAKM